MKKGINKYLGALIVGTALMAVPSCTDTWDEHYQTENAGTASENLWEKMTQRDDLSNFCEIVSMARYYRDEKHPAYTEVDGEKVYYTFKDILQANTPVTVWAPTNDALTEKEWEEYKLMAQNDGYNLQLRFLGNHIALYRKGMTQSGRDDHETFRLINGKFATIYYKDGLFQKSVVKEENKDLPASNGLLNVIEQENEFLYNLYEYIKYSPDDENLTTFRDYLVKRDTTYFLESASIEGLPDENGNPTYVDSVYFQDNLMFSRTWYNPTNIDATDAWMNDLKMLNAEINVEDSTIVMIVPTDDAWKDATQRLQSHYKYASAYPRMDKTINSSTKDATFDIFKARKTFENGKGYETVDSLQTVNIDMDIIAPLAFNLSRQPQVDGREWTLKTFLIEKGYKRCPYLLNTQGDTIRDVYEIVNGVKIRKVWEKNSLFEDASIKEIKEMSNGYAIKTDKWNFPLDYWKSDIDFDVEYRIYDNITGAKGTMFDINNSTTADWIDMYGRCSAQRFMNISGRSSNTNPWFVVSLWGNRLKNSADVMSGKYDVQVVLVPDWYRESNEPYPDTMYPKGGNADESEDEEGTGEETALEDGENNDYKVLPEYIKKNKITCTLYYWDESLIGGSDLKYDKQKSVVSEVIEYSGEKVDTITVLTDVEFPLSYQNLLRAYPVLKIESTPSNDDVRYNGYIRELNIDRIILKAKDAE